LVQQVQQVLVAQVEALMVNPEVLVVQDLS
jgi:hypothetical protein